MVEPKIPGRKDNIQKTPTVPDPTALAKALQARPVLTETVAKTNVSELLHKKNNGTHDEQKQAVLSLIELVAAKEGDLGKKTAILFRLMAESEGLRALGDAVKTLTKNEKVVGELVDVAISRDGQLRRGIADIVSSYRSLNEQEPGCGTRNIMMSFGYMDQALLVAIKASGIANGIKEIEKFRREECSVGPTVEESFLYSILNPVGTVPISSRKLDSEIRGFLA